MVAKITIGSGLFGAIKYNADKVNEGKGQLPVFHIEEETFEDWHGILAHDDLGEDGQLAAKGAA